MRTVDVILVDYYRAVADPAAAVARAHAQTREVRRAYDDDLAALEEQFRSESEADRAALQKLEDDHRNILSWASDVGIHPAHGLTASGGEPAFARARQTLQAFKGALAKREQAQLRAQQAYLAAVEEEARLRAAAEAAAAAASAKMRRLRIHAIVTVACAAALMLALVLGPGLATATIALVAGGLVTWRVGAFGRPMASAAANPATTHLPAPNEPRGSMRVRPVPRRRSFPVKHPILTALMALMFLPLLGSVLALPALTVGALLLLVVGCARIVPMAADRTARQHPHLHPYLGTALAAGGLTVLATAVAGFLGGVTYSMPIEITEPTVPWLIAVALSFGCLVAGMRTRAGALP